MNKNMKKVGTMLLIGLVAVGTYFVSGTYAKYTSTISGNSNVNVAKWSWTINDKTFTSNADVTSGHTFSLFNNIVDTKDGNTDADVNSNLIAPGTKGSFKITITNNSEVNATYAINFTETQTNLLKDDSNNDIRIPVEYSIDGTNWVSNINDLDITASETETKLTTAANGNKVEKTIQWRWSFVGADSTNYKTTQTDTTDTNLGFAANRTNQVPSVAVTADITFTQVD